MDNPDWLALIYLLLFLIFLLTVILPHRLAYFFANRLQKPHLAISIYNWMIRLHYTVGSAYINRAQAYLVLKNYQQALQDVQRGLELRPNSAIGYGNQGAAYLHLREYHLALQSYNKAIELNPLLYAAYQTRCFVYLRLKEYRLAWQDCEYLLNVLPAYFPVLALSAVCHIYLGQYQQAIEQADAALALNPYDANCYHNRGSAYLALGNLAQARADFLRSQELDPAGIEHGFMLEWYRLGFEQPDQEMPERLETLAALNVHGLQQQIPYLCRGIARWLRGSYEEGLVEFEKGLALEPNDEELYFWVAMACASLEREREAQEALNHALQLGLFPFLLMPLKLLQTQQPTFFTSYAQPLLARTGQV